VRPIAPRRHRQQLQLAAQRPNALARDVAKSRKKLWKNLENYWKIVYQWIGSGENLNRKP